jgi:ElaB/YqjD/DUF883 family membrane-anchored ribosome-binding protein
MARDYASTYGLKPNDPGITSELAFEAIDDAKKLVAETAHKVRTGASDAAEQISRSAKAAYEHPAEYAELSWRSYKRYAQTKPLEAVAVAAGTAFVFGALWGLGRR